MDIITDQVTAYRKEVNGCKRHSKEIMVAVSQKDEPGVKFFDVFMTNEQAEDLILTLRKRIDENKRELVLD